MSKNVIDKTFVMQTDEDFELVWTRTGDQGDVWLEGAVSVPAQATPASVVLEGVRGSHWGGDMAVDDVVIKAGACPNSRKRRRAQLEGVLH